MYSLVLAVSWLGENRLLLKLLKFKTLCFKRCDKGIPHDTT